MTQSSMTGRVRDITEGSNEYPAVMELCSKTPRTAQSFVDSLTKTVTYKVVLSPSELDTSHNEVKSVATAFPKVEEVVQQLRGLQYSLSTMSVRCQNWGREPNTRRLSS